MWSSRSRSSTRRRCFRRSSPGGWRGAGLDVSEEEPLPPGSPLWDARNLIVTHHCAGNYPEYVAKATQGFARNLRRYLAGEPLESVVEKTRGYSIAGLVRRRGL